MFARDISNFSMYRRPHKYYFILIILFIFNIISLINIQSLQLVRTLVTILIVLFIPGLIFLSIIKKTSSTILNILYIVGISIVFNIALNILLSILNNLIVHVSLNLITLLLSYDIFITILLTTDYFLNNNLPLIEIRHEMRIKNVAILIIFPSLAIIGSFAWNNYGVNLVTIILILILATFPFYYKKESLHPYLIWAAGISVLISMSATSSFIWGWDINIEYNVAANTIQNGFWDYNNTFYLNSLLTMVFIPVSIHLLSGIELYNVLKYILPIIFSLVPLGIYIFASKFFNKNIAFLSALLFIFFYGFYKDMVDKQYLAEFFFILILIISFIDKNNKLLLILFLFGLCFSHYGITYLLAICLLFVYLFQYILSKKKIFNEENISITSIVLLMVISTSWYFYSSSGNVLITLINVGNNIYTSVIDIFTPQERTVSTYLFWSTPTLTWLLYKIIFILLIIFILFGALKSILKYVKNKSEYNPYIALTIIFTIMVLIQVVSNLSLGLDRMIQITLIVLAPIAVFGLFELCSIVRIKNAYPIFATFIAILFVFNCGLIHVVTSEKLPYAINTQENPEWHVYEEDEVNGMNAAKHYTDNISVINIWKTIKSRDGSLAESFFSIDSITPVDPNIPKCGNYLFLGKISISEAEFGDKYVQLNKTQLYHKITDMSNVYSSPNSKIFFQDG